jgi:hypothetical protein
MSEHSGLNAASKHTALSKIHSQKYGSNVHPWRCVLITELAIRFLVIVKAQMVLCSSYNSPSLEAFLWQLSVVFSMGEIIYLRTDF